MELETKFGENQKKGSEIILVILKFKKVGINHEFLALNVVDEITKFVASQTNQLTKLYFYSTCYIVLGSHFGLLKNNITC